MNLYASVALGFILLIVFVPMWIMKTVRIKQEGSLASHFDRAFFVLLTIAVLVFLVAHEIGIDKNSDLYFYLNATMIFLSAGVWIFTFEYFIRTRLKMKKDRG